jgi:hypothetical protein
MNHNPSLTLDSTGCIGCEGDKAKSYSVTLSRA